MTTNNVVTFNHSAVITLRSAIDEAKDKPNLRAFVLLQDTENPDQSWFIYDANHDVTNLAWALQQIVSDLTD